MPQQVLQISEELRRLEHGPAENEKPQGVGTVRFLVRCPFDPEGVLIKTKRLLKVVDEIALTGWLTEEQWTIRLPQWFVSRCVTPLTQEEAEQQIASRKGLPLDEQARLREETEWSLDAWLYWMQPSNRQWFWWDAVLLHEYDHIAVAVEVEAWPFPWAALRWMFKAAGASAVDAEE